MPLYGKKGSLFARVVTYARIRRGSIGVYPRKSFTMYSQNSKVDKDDGELHPTNVSDQSQALKDEMHQRTWKDIVNDGNRKLILIVKTCTM